MADEVRAGDWTAAEVRERLPDIKVDVNGVELVGRVTGRSQDMARVFVRLPFGKKPGDVVTLTDEFSWAGIARALNNGDRLFWR
jgi:hypothetical protein